jgi:hypothetical protein
VPVAPAELRLPPALAPAGDLALSLGDHVRYARAHLAGLRRGHPLLARAMWRTLHTRRGTYSLGWAEVDVGGVPTSYSVGGTGRFTAVIALQPTRDRGAVALTNAGGERGVEDALNELVVAALAG